jgi:hypothetical protein
MVLKISAVLHSDLRLCYVMLSTNHQKDGSENSIATLSLHREVAVNNDELTAYSLECFDTVQLVIDRS